MNDYVEVRLDVTPCDENATSVNMIMRVLSPMAQDSQLM